MVFFKDLCKSVKSLLKDDYSVNEVSVEAKGKSSNGVDLTLEASKKCCEDTVEGGFKWKNSVHHDDLTVDLSGSVCQEGTVKEEATLKGLHDGLKLAVNVTLLQKADNSPLNACSKKEGKTTRNTVGGKVTFSNDHVGVNASLTKKAKNPVKFDVDVAGVLHDNVSVGAKFSVPLKSTKDLKCCDKLCDCEVAVKLHSDDVTVSAALNDCGKKTALNVVHQYCDKLTVGLQLTNKGFAFPFCFKKAAAKDGEKEEEKKEEKVEEKKEEKKEGKVKRTWGLTAGFQYKGDDNSTLKGKVTDTGVATVSYSFDLRENLRSTVSYETNVSSLGNDSKVGFAFALEK